MQNFKLIIEYDGTNYFGWQAQRNKKFPTVQDTIEGSLKRIFKKKVYIVASGRTDTGVHAREQIAHLKISTCLTAQNIKNALNAYLPKDVLIKEVREVPIDFHARYSAKRKWYRYTILTSKLPSVFIRNYVYHYPYLLNISLMRKAAALLKGKHDFAKIVCGMPISEEREIYDFKIKKDKQCIYIDVVGSGFLYKMVRKLAGLLIAVSKGKITLKDLQDAIKNNNPNLPIVTAPAEGLTLMKVHY